MDYQVWLMFSDRDFSVIGYVPKRPERIICDCAVVAFRGIRDSEIRLSNRKGGVH